MERRIDQAGPSTRYLEDVAKRISEYLIGGSRAEYDLGRIVDEVILGHYWSRDDWPGAPEGGWPDNTAGFKAWCWGVLGFRYRKAYYLRNIYLAFTAMDVRESGLTFVRALRQGWSKVTIILREAQTEARLIYWLDRCENYWCVQCNTVGAAGECPQCGAVMQRPLTESGLKSEIAIALGDDGSDPETGEPSEPMAATPTVAQEEKESEAPANVQKRAKATRVEFPLTFEDADTVRMFIRALDIVKARTGTDSNGMAAARMAVAYLATTPHDDEGGLVMELAQMLGIIESAWGVRLRVVSDAPGGGTGGRSAPAPSGADAAMEGFE